MVIAGGIVILLALIYTALPFWLKIVVMIINTFLPDPIPAVDEVLMFAAIIGHILRIAKVHDFITKHKILSVIIGLLLLGLIIFGIWYLISFVFS